MSDLSALPYTGLTKRGALDREIYDKVAENTSNIYSYFDFDTPLDLARFVNSLVCCTASTREQFLEPRFGKSKNQIISALKKLENQYKKIDNLYIEYPELKYALNEVSWLFEHGLPNMSDTFNHLPGIHAFIHVMLRHIEFDVGTVGEAGRFLNLQSRTTKPKLNCVDKAAFICKRFRGPKLTSTPGSDFSFICGMLFEFATGRAGESMQGSIISLFQGERPELYWYSDIKSESKEYISALDGDIWAVKYEKRRAEIMLRVAESFKNDLSIYSYVLGKAVERFKAANEWMECVERRRKAGI